VSTNRGIVIPAAARFAFRAVQSLSEPLAARLVERWFFTPPRRRLPGEIEALLREGRRFDLRVDGRPVVGWVWGDGPTVYLAHGWGSSGGRLGAFVRPLVETGHRVVTYDAPGHGASGNGRSSAPEFARTLQAVAERHGPARAVIAHSLGGSATLLAVRWGFAAERFALLAPAVDPGAFAYAFADVLGARPSVMERARVRTERRLRFAWSDLDVRSLTPSLGASALVVHDRGDTTVPFEEGAAIAASWPGARLLPTSGLGHHGVVRDPSVIAEVTRFVADPATGTSSGESSGRTQEMFVAEHPRIGQ
jgi:pimeloyl-ACP methyl ester carboxylesterase